MRKKLERRNDGIVERQEGESIKERVERAGMKQEPELYGMREISQSSSSKILQVGVEAGAQDKRQ